MAEKYRSKICVNTKCPEYRPIADKWNWGFKYCPYCGEKLKARIVEPITITLVKRIKK